MAIIFKRGSSLPHQSTTPDDSTHDPAATSLAGFNLQDLADESREQLDTARQKAEQILAEARLDAERIREEAKHLGYQRGLELANSDADAKLQDAAEQRARSGIEMIQSILDQLRDVHEQWMQDYAASLHTIALAAAEKIVQRELTIDPQLLTSWADQAVRSTRAASQLTVAVHPETLALLGQSLDEMLAASDLPEQTYVEPDASLGTTEVAVRQSGGQINAGLTAQLRRLQELLA